MSKFIFVLGAESTGTRLMVKVLLSSADSFGSSDHGQPFDRALGMRTEKTLCLFDRFSSHPYCIFRRSLPHGRKWPSMEYPLEVIMKTRSFLSGVVITTRERSFAVQSQRKSGHVFSVDAGASNFDRAYRLLDEFCASLPQLIIKLSLRIFGDAVPDYIITNPPVITVKYSDLVRGQLPWAREHIATPFGMHFHEGLFPTLYDGNTRYRRRAQCQE